MISKRTFVLKAKKVARNYSNPVTLFKLKVFKNILKDFHNPISYRNRYEYQIELIKPFDIEIYVDCLVKGLSNGYLWSVLDQVNYAMGFQIWMEDNNPGLTRIPITPLDVIKYESSYNVKYGDMTFSYLDENNISFRTLLYDLKIIKNLDPSSKVSEALKSSLLSGHYLYRAMINPFVFDLLLLADIKRHIIHILELLIGHFTTIYIIKFLKMFVDTDKISTVEAKSIIANIILYEISKIALTNKNITKFYYPEKILEECFTYFIEEYSEPLITNTMLKNELIFLFLNELHEEEWLKTFLDSLREAAVQGFDFKYNHIVLNKKDIHFVLTTAPFLFSFDYYVKKGLYNDLILGLSEGSIKIKSYLDYDESILFKNR